MPLFVFQGTAIIDQVCDCCSAMNQVFNYNKGHVCLQTEKTHFKFIKLAQKQFLNSLPEKQHVVPQPNETPDVEIPHRAVPCIRLPIIALPVKESLHLYNVAFNKNKSHR